MYTRTKKKNVFSFGYTLLRGTRKDSVLQLWVPLGLARTQYFQLLIPRDSRGLCHCGFWCPGDSRGLSRFSLWHLCFPQVYGMIRNMEMFLLGL